MSCLLCDEFDHSARKDLSNIHFYHAMSERVSALRRSATCDRLNMKYGDRFLTISEAHEAAL
jgi:hypothetical protein